MSCSNNFINIYKNKYDSQTWNTEGIIDVKEQICLKKIKYFRLPNEYLVVLVFCMYTHVYNFNVKYL